MLREFLFDTFEGLVDTHFFLGNVIHFNSTNNTVDSTLFECRSYISFIHLPFLYTWFNPIIPHDTIEVNKRNNLVRIALSTFSIKHFNGTKLQPKVPLS